MKITRVLAFVFTAFISIFSSGAHADDWGCEVLLCLSNPNGPTAVSQCEPPIKKLYDHLSKKKPFPTCDMASNKESGKSWAEQGYSWFDNCPAGTTQLPSGEAAIQGDKSTLTSAQTVDINKVVFGLDESSGTNDGGGTGNVTRKICGGAQLGTITITTGQGDNSSSMAINVYNQIVVLDRAASPRLINVYISDKLYRTVRW